MSTLLNIVAFVTSVGAIYFTTNASGPYGDGRRRLGCLIGIVASILNIGLTLDGAPAVLGLSVVCLIIYIKGARLPDLCKKLWSLR